MSAIVFLVIGVCLPILGYKIAKSELAEDTFDQSKQIIDQLIVFTVGVIFAGGLMVSGMARRVNILGFLIINSDWNPSLLLVLSFGVAINFVSFTFMRKRGTSFNGNAVFDPKNNKIDWQLILGAVCFGAGWGIGGLCPGPFLVLFAVFTLPIQVLWGTGLVIGMLCAKKIQEIVKNREEAATKQPLV